MMQPLPMSLEDFFPRVAAMGFAAVEIWKPDATFPAIADLAHQNHLVLASFSGHDSLGIGLNNPAEHTRIVDELGKSIDLAVEYGVPGIICFSGNRLPGQSEAEAIAATVDGLRQIAPYAEQKNINLNMELLNSRVDHAGYQCDHSAWGLEVVKAVNSRNVKLLYDIYHMQIMEGDLIATILANIEWIGHFHTAGVPGRRDLDDTQEINYRGLMQALSKTSYNLYVGHEFRPKGELFGALQQAYTVCNLP
jgi:hydroxypyruvate isomerase